MTCNSSTATWGDFAKSIPVEETIAHVDSEFYALWRALVQEVIHQVNLTTLDEDMSEADTEKYTWSFYLKSATEEYLNDNPQIKATATTGKLTFVEYLPTVNPSHIPNIETYNEKRSQAWQNLMDKMRAMLSCTTACSGPSADERYKWHWCSELYCDYHAEGISAEDYNEYQHQNRDYSEEDYE